MNFASIVHRLDSAAAYAWAIHDKARERQEDGEDMILLSVGDPDFDTPPAITDVAIASLRAGRTHYGGFARPSPTGTESRPGRSSRRIR